MTKFKIYTQDPVIGYDARTKKPVRDIEIMKSLLIGINFFSGEL
jgi:hypothetical protein